MGPARLRLPLLVLGLAASLVAAPRPKLVVVISVDQMSAQLLEAFGPELRGGLGRLRREGTYFTEAYHDHGITETGPGHSVLLSGRFPTHTGIVENRWVERSTGQRVYCVEDAASPNLNAPDRAGSSNARLLGDELGDWLQAQVPGSRVFAVSGKDRAAILMAGRRPTGVYWFSAPAGFTTSRAYAPQLPGWLQAFDQELSRRLTQDSWLWMKEATTPEGRVGSWTFGETVVRNGALPRMIQGLGMPMDKGFEFRFRTSPFLDAVTFEAAEALLESERLGRGPATDLLALSLSSTDYIGHQYGMLGTEMRDQIHRLDAGLGQFLDHLKQRHPDAWVVLSADHGALDIVEVLAEQGLQARRLASKPFMEALEDHLRGVFHVKTSLLKAPLDPLAITLDPVAIRDAKLDFKQVLLRAQAWLRTRGEVADAFTHEELLATDPAAVGSPRDSSVRVLLRRSFHPDRSPDLMVAMKPLVMVGGPPSDYPAGHGSPHAYDRRVPLIFLGPWKAGFRREPVRVVDLAPTLARELGLKPGPVDGKPLDLPSR